MVNVQGITPASMQSPGIEIEHEVSRDFVLAFDMTSGIANTMVAVDPEMSHSKAHVVGRSRFETLDPEEIRLCIAIRKSRS